MKQMRQKREDVDLLLQQVGLRQHVNVTGPSKVVRRRDASLVRAATHGDAEALQDAIASGADPNARNGRGEAVLLIVSYRPQNLSLIRLLLLAGADPNAADRDGNTPLIGSVRDDDLEVVKELIAAGANPNARNRDGDTPLTNASVWGSRRVVEFLLAHGANPDLSDGLGCRPEDLARQQGHTAIAKRLRKLTRPA